MKWKDIVKAAAPVVGSLIPGGGPILSLAAAALGTEPTEEAIAKAVTTDPEAATKLKQLEMEHKTELQKLFIEQQIASQREINETMRAELKADDKFKTYWRPMFGYVGAIAWLLQTLAIVGLVVYSVVCEDKSAVTDLYNGATSLFGALTTQWTILLTVLGVNVHQRSKDKQIQAGHAPKGLLSFLSK